MATSVAKVSLRRLFWLASSGLPTREKGRAVSFITSNDYEVYTITELIRLIPLR